MTVPVQICGIIKSSGNSLQMVVERGDHIVPNFEEIWPSNKDKDAKYKRRLIGMEYYMDAMEHHGLKVHTLSCQRTFAKFQSSVSLLRVTNSTFTSNCN